MTTSSQLDGRPDEPAPLHTPSLRRRITLAVLAVLAVMVLALALVADLVLESRLESQQRQRLLDRASVASALVDQVEARDLARRLEGDGVSVVLRTGDGQVYAEGPLAGAALEQGGDAATQPAEPAQSNPRVGGPAGGPDAGTPPRPAGGLGAVTQSGNLLAVTRTLADGSTVELLADATDVRRTLSQVRLAFAVAALLVLLIAAATVPLVVARTLRPLDRITSAARDITRGDRSRRLRPHPPGSELGRTAAAFDEMLDEIVGAERTAVTSEQRLRYFLADAAHELRTPLTGAQAAAEHVLRDDPPRLAREQTLLNLVRQTSRAGRLVDDMLQMARIDQGLTLDRRPFDPLDLAHELTETRAHAQPRVTFEVHGDHVTVLADRDRVAQILTNLLDNAVHATTAADAPTPVPKITITVARDAAAATAVIDVHDNGTGVAEADRERIFDHMARLDRARTAQHGGAGLGLTIARGLARAHDGDLTYHAPTGPGASFRLVLPHAT